jgi:hypothetical protein
VASGPDEAGAWPVLPDGGGSGERDGEVYARNRCVKPPKMSHQLEIWRIWAGCSACLPDSGAGNFRAGHVGRSGDHGEGLRRSRGDAAGV